MLALTRQKDTSILIGQDIIVTFRGFREGEAMIEVALPSSCPLRGPQGPIETQPSDETGVCMGLAYLKKGDSIQIGDEIAVQVIRMVCSGGLSPEVRLGLDAPSHVAIIRHELAKAGQIGPLFATKMPTRLTFEES